MLAQYFRKTLKDYKITAKQLSEMTGVSQNHLSEFRRGKSCISDEVLWKLLVAMDEIKPGARRYFCLLMAGESVEREAIGNLVKDLPEEELPDLFSALAKRWETSNGKVLQAH